MGRIFPGTAQFKVKLLIAKRAFTARRELELGGGGGLLYKSDRVRDRMLVENV